jgi:predicted O-methyltransferase YrrM
MPISDKSLKFKKLIFSLFYILRQPSLLSHVFEKSNFWQKYIERQYGITEGLPSVELDELLPNFSETLATVSFLGGSSMPTDLALLKGLARKITNCQYFEIGTWRGESVANLAEAAGKCLTLNLSKEEIAALNIAPAYADLHGFFSKRFKNVVHLEGNSKNYDFSQHPKMDLIFIDGDHQYSMVKNDTEQIFQHLMHENSIVVWHDYAYHPEEIRHEVLAGILDGLPNDVARGRLYYVFNTMCAIYLPYSMPKDRFLQFPKRPERVFEVALTSHKTNDSPK